MSEKSYPKYRLFVEQPLAMGISFPMGEAQSHYLSHVLRLHEGDAVRLFNGKDGEWLAEIAEVRKKQVTLRIMKVLKAHYTSPDLWLAFAPIKHGRIDWLVEKATELGVSRLIPVMTEHTMVSRVNIDRLRAHAVEAAEQSGRLEVPILENAVSLTTLLSGWPKERILIYGDEQGTGKPANEVLGQMKRAPYAALVGPEAGFSASEHVALKRMGAMPVSLGPRVMRADTAALALITVMQSWLGDWHTPPKFFG